MICLKYAGEKLCTYASFKLNRLRVFGAHNESRVAHLVWQVLILFPKSSEAILI